MSKKEKLSVEPYKGVRDFYPEDQAFLNYLTSTYRGVLERFGYVEYHASVLEPSELYKSKSAENEEIINDQSYTFIDRGGREVTLRPEMTPTAARMVAARRRDLGFPLRLYSIPNVFRYERPQRGRLREHWQLNVDLFGSKSLSAEVEVISVVSALMAAFGAEEKDFEIRLNSRAALNTLIEKLGFSQKEGNALLKLLDRRDKIAKTEFEEELKKLGLSPEQLSEAFERVPEDVAAVLSGLKAMGITNAVFSGSVVRGFNYYTGVVFEVFDTHSDNNRALFGGGRYDNLTGMFDEEPVTGVGFGMGDVTMRDFLDVRNMLPKYAPPTRAYIAVAASGLSGEAQKLAQELRLEGIAVAVDFGDKKLADQIKTASKHSIPYLIVLGENELASGQFVVRDLATGKEETLARTALAEFFLNR